MKTDITVLKKKDFHQIIRVKGTDLINRRHSTLAGCENVINHLMCCQTGVVQERPAAAGVQLRVCRCKDSMAECNVATSGRNTEKI